MYVVCISSLDVTDWCIVIVLVDDLEKAYRIVDNSLFHLDSPTNKGNQSATTRGLLDSSKDLAAKIANLVNSVHSGKEGAIKAAIEALIESNKKFMDDAKGCSYLTEDPEVKRILLEIARCVVWHEYVGVKSVVVCCVWCVCVV